MSEGSAAQKKRRRYSTPRPRSRTESSSRPPLEDTAGAHRAVENGATGKVLIAVD
jgi:hypothetical protein